MAAAARLAGMIGRLALLAALLAAAALVWRAPLAEAVARDLLAAQGFPDARLSIAELRADGASVRDLALPGAGIQAAHLRLRYSPSGLAQGRLAAVELEGLSVEAERAAARLRALRGDGDAAAPGGLAIGRVALREARLHLPPPWQGAVGVSADLDLSGPAPAGRIRLEADLAAARARLALRSEGFGAGGRVTLEGDAQADLAALPLPDGLAPRPASGRAELRLSGAATAPETDLQDPLAWLPGLALDGHLALDGAGLSGRPERLSGALAWRVAGGEGRLDLSLPRPARFEIAGPAGLLAALLPAAAEPAPPLALTLRAEGPLLAWRAEAPGGRAVLAGDLRLARGEAEARLDARLQAAHGPGWARSGPVSLDGRLSARGLAPPGAAEGTKLESLTWTLSGALAPDGALSLRGPVEARVPALRLPGASAEAAALSGEIVLRRDGPVWRASASALTLRAESATLPGAVRLDAPVALTVETAEAVLGDGPPRLSARAAAQGLSGVLPGDPGLRFAEAGGRAELTLAGLDPLRGRLALSEGALSLTGPQLALEEVSAVLPLGDGQGAPHELSARLRDLARPARFPPARLALTRTPEGEALALSGDLRALDGRLTLPLSGRAEPAAGAARLRAGPARLDFARGGLQPRDLGAPLAALGRARGGAEIEARARLRPEGRLSTALTLTLEDLSLDRGDVAVEGLSGALAFDSLTPPAFSGQRLAARRLIAGVPLDAPRLTLSLRPGPVLRLEDFGAGLAGGEVRIAAADWRPGAQANALRVALREVSLDRLLRDWRISGISGEGRLSGDIPVRVGPQGVGIDGGEVAAGGPGVLRVDWGPARERLVGSGREVRLAVEALENFRYDTLSVRLSKGAGGPLELGIALAGANPDVLDGYPFQFNINLSGDLDPILRAVREGRRIGGALLEGGIGAGR